MSNGTVSEKSWLSTFEGLRWKADTCTQFVKAELLWGTSIQTHDSCTQQKVSELWNQVIMEEDPEAMVILGRVYMRGFEGFQCKYSQALELFCQAADTNNSEAFMALLRLLSSAENIHEKQSEFVARAEKAAKNKNPGAMFCLGALYSLGLWGVAKDQEKAQQFISEAAVLGSSSAMLVMARRFSTSTDAAISWCNEAIAAGNKTGYLMLGESYSSIGDKQKALDAFQKGMVNGDLGSIMVLAHLFRHGIDVPKDETKAIELYRKAVALGCRSMLFEIATLHAGSERCAQAVAECEKALSYEENRQDYFRMYHLALLYYHGGSDLSPDEQKGYRWLSQAAYQRDVMALFSLAEKVGKGQGCQIDQREAQRLRRLYDDIINKPHDTEQVDVFGFLV